MAAVNDQHKVTVTVNGSKVTIPAGLHDMKQAAAYMGVPTASKLTITDPTPRSSAVFTPNMSLVIQGGEIITSSNG